MRINTDRYTSFGVEVNEFKDNIMFVVYGIFITGTKHILYGYKTNEEAEQALAKLKRSIE